MVNPMWYNISAVHGDNGVLGLMQSVDSIFFFHFFGAAILLTLFIIMFRAMISYNQNPKVSFMYCAFFIAFLSILFRMLSLVNNDTVFIAIIVFVLSIAAQFLID